MRVDVEIPSWMIADGEYRGLAVGDLREFGFVLDPTSVVEVVSPLVGSLPDVAPNGTMLRGRLRDLVGADGRELGVVLDDRLLFPLLRGNLELPPVGSQVEVIGTLLAEPYLWAADGVFWSALPRAVSLWTVRSLQVQPGHGDVRALSALPEPARVDHDARYVVALGKAARP